MDFRKSTVRISKNFNHTKNWMILGCLQSKPAGLPYVYIYTYIYIYIYIYILIILYIDILLESLLPV